MPDTRPPQSPPPISERAGASAYEPDDWTRRLAHRVDWCIDRDRTILDKLAARERIPDLIDCTPERLATEAIRADQEWVWAALSLLRWLCEPWPKDETRAEAREVE